MALPNVGPLSTQRFDIEDAPTAHADGKIDYVCNAGNGFFDSNDLFDDDTKVVGQSTPNGYEISYYTNSESNVGVWGNGKFTFSYNQAANIWALRSYALSNNVYVDWRLCQPNEVFDIAIEGIQCIEKDNNTSMAEIIDSLKAQKTNIVATSVHYASEIDCEPKPAPVSVNPITGGPAGYIDYPSDYMMW